MGDFIDDSEMVIEENVKAVSTDEAESPNEIHDQVELVAPKTSPRKRVMPSWNKEQWARLKEKRAREAATQVAGIVTNNENDERIDAQDSSVVEKGAKEIVSGPESEDTERVDTDVDMPDVEDLLNFMEKRKRGKGNSLSGLAETESVSGVKSAETMDNNMKTPVLAAPLSSVNDNSSLIADRAEDDVLKVTSLLYPLQKIFAEKRRPSLRAGGLGADDIIQEAIDYYETVAANKKRLWKRYQDNDWKPDDSTDDDEIISDRNETSTSQSPPCPSSPVKTDQDAAPTPVSSLSSSHLGTDRRPIPLDSDDEWDEGPATKVPRIDNNEYSSLPIDLKVRRLIESKTSEELYRLIIVLIKKMANKQQSR